MSSVSDFFELDISQWPMAKLHIVREPASTAELNNFFQACRQELYENSVGGQFILYVDTEGVGSMNWDYLYKLAGFMREMEPLTKKLMLELGLLVRSDTIRFIITCIKSLKRPAVPWHLMDDQEAYRRWVDSLVERELMFPLT